MKRMLLLVSLLALAAVPASTARAADVDPVPSGWSLSQNDPNPMCGATRIVFGVAQNAHVQFAIWNADQTAVVRLLLEQMLPAGIHAVLWDGHDEQGGQVPDGQYVYRYIALVDGATVFDSSVVFQVDCSVAVEGVAWGYLKSSYWH